MWTEAHRALQLAFEGDRPHPTDLTDAVHIPTKPSGDSGFIRSFDTAGEFTGAVWR